MDAKTDRPDAFDPIDLAREPDFALGPSKVSPSTREVLRGTERELLEPRLMQVLVALFQANGRVVSRDELIARCWEGRIVGEDAINRAISRLRRLSEVDREASFQLETIPRVGYRLLLPGSRETLSSAPAPIAADNPSSRSVRSGDAAREPSGSLFVRHRLMAAAVILLVIGGAGAWLSWPAPRWTVESSRPFISTLALEGEPVFSPDGKMLAYVSGPDVVSNKIYVRSLTGGDAIKITNDAYDDHAPSWSSDGAHIAYIAQKPGEPCHIMVVTVPAGEAREVGRCRKTDQALIAWQPNSPFLYFTDQRDNGDRGISRLDLDTGARLDIVKGNVRSLCVSPDGKSLAYLVSDRWMKLLLTIRDLTSGKERILDSISGSALEVLHNSVAWFADSKIVLATAASGNGSEIIAFPVDGSAPYRIYASAAPISRLSVSAGGLLAIQSHISRKNLARASPTPITQPDIIDPAAGITVSPTFAPDGTLAFASDRSGTNAIWIKKPGAVPVRLFDAGFAVLSGGKFSPDGTQLAVMIIPVAKNGVTIKVLTANGASVASFDLPSLGYGLTNWTPDGKGLIVWDSSIRRAVRVDVADPAHRAPVAPPDWQGITIRNDGIFATRADRAGIWRIDGGIRLLNSKYRAGWTPPIVFLGDDVLIPDFNAAGGPRILAQPVNGGPDRVLAYAPGAEGLGFQSRMTVNPKTGEIIYVATVQSDTNIDLLTLAKH